MALDPQLLEILACPEDKGPLLYFADEDALYNPRLKRALRDPRRHPGHADRRGRDGRRRRARAADGQGRRPRASTPTFDGVTRDRGERLDTLGHVRRRRRRCPSRSRRRGRRRGGVDGLPDARRHRATSSCSAWAAAASPATSLAAVAGPFMPVPVVVHKGYELPAFVGDDTLVFAVSFSGNTEETVEAATEAAVAGRPAWSSSPAAASWPSWPTAWGAPHRRACPTTSPCPGPASAPSPSRRSSCSSRSACSPAPTQWIDRGRRPARAPARRSWSPTATRPSSWPAASAARCPLIYGGGAIGAVAAAAVEDPVQRERQGRRRSANAHPRAVPQRGLRLGPARRRHPPGVHAWSQLRHDYEHPQVARRFELVDRARRRGRRPTSTRSRPRATGPLAQLLDLVLVRRLRVARTWRLQEGIDPGPVPVLDEIKARLAESAARLARRTG